MRIQWVLETEKGYRKVIEEFDDLEILPEDDSMVELTNFFTEEIIEEVWNHSDRWSGPALVDVECKILCKDNNGYYYQIILRCYDC